MTEVGFYHLQKWPLERALPKLLERVLAADLRAVVMAGSAERLAALDALLWTYDPDGFLPHGTAADGNAALQPVWLTTEDEAPNSATVLVLCDGAESERVHAFDRCLDMFDGNDPEAVAAARLRWRAYQAAGHGVAYWQQTERGGWEQKA